MSQENVEVVRKPLRVRQRSMVPLDQRLALRFPRWTDSYIRLIGKRPSRSRLRQVALWRGVRDGVEAYVDGLAPITPLLVAQFEEALDRRPETERKIGTLVAAGDRIELELRTPTLGAGAREGSVCHRPCRHTGGSSPPSHRVTPKAGASPQHGLAFGSDEGEASARTR
jgi:hypothetical protein